MPERLGRNQPERTRRFFNQEPKALAFALTGRIIIFPETSKKIRIDDAQWWAKRQVGQRYAMMQEMRPGDVAIVRLPIRRMNQTLVVASDKDGVGACVRILRASRFDEATQDFTKMDREGDIATYLGLEDGDTLSLSFAERSQDLILVRQSDNISPEEANSILQELSES